MNLYSIYSSVSTLPPSLIGMSCMSYLPVPDYYGMSARCKFSSSPNKQVKSTPPLKPLLSINKPTNRIYKILLLPQPKQKSG
jgi:hypothetical protein